MKPNKVSAGIFHKMPKDLEKALLSNKKAFAAWESISPIARNEWICWTINVKLEKTREEHVKRAIGELAEGKKRPCCWVGCIHRTDKPVGAWAQKVLVEKQKRGK
jgi:Bacteriocin-protection, YdeI or OmpD-Associated